MTFLFKPANPLPLVRKSLWCNEQMRRNPLLNHVLFLQTKYLEANRRQDGLDGPGSTGQNRLPTLFDNDQVWQQGLLHVKIFGVKHQHYQQKRQGRGAFFKHSPLSSWLGLESWFSHVYTLSCCYRLQQLIHFVLPAIEEFSKEVTPWKCIHHDTRFVGRPQWSVFYFGKKSGVKGGCFLLPLQTWLHRTNIPRQVLGCLKKFVYDWLLQKVHCIPRL